MSHTQIVFDEMLLDFETKIEQSFAFHLSLVELVPTHVDFPTGKKSLEQKVTDDLVCRELQTSIRQGFSLFY